MQNKILASVVGIPAVSCGLIAAFFLFGVPAKFIWPFVVAALAGTVAFLIYIKTKNWLLYTLASAGAACIAKGGLGLGVTARGHAKTGPENGQQAFSVTWDALWGSVVVIDAMLILAGTVLFGMALYLQCKRENLLQSNIHTNHPDASDASFLQLIHSNPKWGPIWDSLDDKLQDAFLLAANEARRRGKHILSTKDLFRALVRLNPSPLEQLMRELPAESLPEPVETTHQDRDALLDIEMFSNCVQDSLDNLVPKSTPDEKLSTEDVFVDIARHGTGSSVQRLRTHGVSANAINELVRQMGWSVIERTPANAG